MSLCLYVLKNNIRKICPYVFMSKKLHETSFISFVTCKPALLIFYAGSE